MISFSFSPFLQIHVQNVSVIMLFFSSLLQIHVNMNSHCLVPNRIKNGISIVYRKGTGNSGSSRE